MAGSWSKSIQPGEIKAPELKLGKVTQATELKSSQPSPGPRLQTIRLSRLVTFYCATIKSQCHSTIFLWVCLLADLDSAGWLCFELQAWLWLAPLVFILGQTHTQRNLFLWEVQRHMKITAQTHFKLLLTSDLPTAHWSKQVVWQALSLETGEATVSTEVVRWLNILKTIMLPTFPAPTEVRFSKGI